MQIDIEEILECEPCIIILNRPNLKNIKIGIYNHNQTHIYDPHLKHNYSSVRKLTTKEMFFLQIHLRG